MRNKGYDLGGSIRPTHLDEDKRKIDDNRYLYVRTSHQQNDLVAIQFDNHVRVTVSAKNLIAVIEAVSR